MLETWTPVWTKASGVPLTSVQCTVGYYRLDFDLGTELAVRAAWATMQEIGRRFIGMPMPGEYGQELVPVPVSVKVGNISKQGVIVKRERDGKYIRVYYKQLQNPAGWADAIVAICAVVGVIVLSRCTAVQKAGEAVGTIAETLKSFGGLPMLLLVLLLVGLFFPRIVTSGRKVLK